MVEPVLSTTDKVVIQIRQDTFDQDPGRVYSGLTCLVPAGTEVFTSVYRTRIATEDWKLTETRAWTRALGTPGDGLNLHGH